MKKSLIIGIIVCCVLATCGVGFGIYGITKANNIEKTINETEKKVAKDDNSKYAVVKDWGIKINLGKKCNIKTEYSNNTTVIYANYPEEDELIETLGENPYKIIVTRSKNVPASNTSIGTVYFEGYYYIIKRSADATMLMEKENEALNNASNETLQLITKTENYEVL